MKSPRTPDNEEPAAERACDFRPVDKGFTEEMALAEAERCLNCKKPFCVEGCPVNINIPRAEWGVGMGHKQINGGLMPGGRLRMEKLARLVSLGKLDLAPLVTHEFKGFKHVEDALYLMKDKPDDLIKPVVII